MVWPHSMCLKSHDNNFRSTLIKSFSCARICNSLIQSFCLFFFFLKFFVL
ncbi:unnamed protein product [Arabidopsis halleri]